MSVYLATSSDYLQRTSGLPSPTGDRTVMYWIRYDSASPPGDYRVGYGLTDSTASYSDWTEVWSLDGVLHLESELDATGAVGVSRDSEPATGVWEHHAIVQSGTTWSFYINGVLIGSYTKNMTGATFNYELLGGDGLTIGDLDLAQYRQWTAALTQAEIQTEMGRSRANRTANLYADTPLENDVTDISGNGRNWTVVGDAAFAAGEELLGGGPKQPVRWLFFVLKKVPLDPENYEFYRWAQQPLSEYGSLPAFIEGRVPLDGWGDIVRAASTMQGEYSVDHSSATLNDVDAQIRALMDNFDTQWFLRRNGFMVLLSGAAFQAGLVPRLLHSGPCSDAQITDGRMAQLEFSDLFEPYLDRNVGQYTMNDAYPWQFTEQDETITEDLNTEDPGLQIPNVMRDQVLPIYYGPFINTKVDPVTGVPKDGLCPPFFMGYTFLSAGTGDIGEPSPELANIMAEQNLANWGGWGELVIGLGEIDVPNVYGYNLITEDPQSVLIPEDRFNTEFLAPGHAGWPFDTNYVMRNGFRLTVIYARGPALWAHLTGGVQITVDVCGWKDANGVMIDQAFYAWQDLITQHVLANDGAGFTSGPSVGLPILPEAIAEGRAKFWTSKIQQAQADSAARLGNDKGYLCSIAITKPTTLREFDRKFNRTFTSFTAKNGAGQVYKFLINDLADATDGVPVREWIEIRRALPAPRIEWDSIENEIDYTVGWIPRLDEPRTPVITKRTDQVYIDALLGEVRKSPDGQRDLEYTADDATAQDVIGRWLILLREPPRYQGLPVGTDGVDREIGEQIRATHRDGFGPDGVGYNLRPMVIMNHIQHGDEITLEALDIRHVIAGAAEWGPESLPAAAEDGTPEEQATYWIWANDDGTIPGGGTGSEWR